MKRVIVIIVLVLFVVSLFCMGCSPCKKLSNSVVSEKKDSSWTKIEVKYKDTIIHTPVDSASIMAMVVCPPNGVLTTPVFIQKSKQATITASIVKNKLVAKCRCDSLEVLLKQKETVLNSYRLQQNNRVEVKTIKEKYIPKWVKVLAVLGVVLLLALIIEIVYKF